MKVLFLTTHNVSWYNEHFFTRNVSLAVSKYLRDKSVGELILGSVFERERSKEELDQIEIKGIKYKNTIIPYESNWREKVDLLKAFFKSISPTIIHSNMIEGFDIQAAKELKIPIVSTIHIGGFICPRGGGNGFLKYDETICSQRIGSDCAHCMAMDMPFPELTYALHKLTPNWAKCFLIKHLKKRILYLSAFLRLTSEPEHKKKFIELAKYTHIIAANRGLVEILAKNGLKDNVHFIPHGVKPRKRLALPPLDGPVKFYYLGRSQYSKGMHIIIDALKGIPKNLYELHVIGDPSYSGKKSAVYFEEQKKKCNLHELNVFFEGRISNDSLEEKIKDYHILIHSTICHEVYGLTIAESLSMGRPVLSTRCKGSEEQIEHGYNGWLIAPNNVAEMRDAIRHIIENKEEILRYSSNAHLPMPLDIYADRIYNLYSEITRR